MDLINHNYNRAATTPGDIVEHIPTLYEYAKNSETILELGVSMCVSTWAFVKGLVDNNSSKKKLISCDIGYHENIEKVKEACTNSGIDFTFEHKSDLDLTFDEGEIFDITFIDTWHIYGQLKRELAKFAPITRNYIIMHDTTIDAIYGESIRDRHDIPSLSLKTGIPVEEITKGLKYAIDEFLENNSEWEVELVKTNNNGLTVLKRIQK